MIRFTSERNTAYHEAGHAVANVVLQREISYLSINVMQDEDGKWISGCCRVDPSSDRTNAENTIVILLVSQFSEQMAGTPYPPGVEGDEDKARCIAFDILRERNILEIALTREQIKEAPALERRMLDWERGDIEDRNAMKVRGLLHSLRIKAEELIQKYESSVEIVAEKLLAAKISDATESTPSVFEDFVGEKAHRMVEDAVSAASQNTNG